MSEISTRVRRPEIIVSEWLEEWIKYRDRYTTMDAVDAAREHFGDDEEYRESIIRYSFDSIVPQSLRSLTGKQRRAAQRHPRAKFPSPREIRRDLDERAQKWASSFLSTWTESVGEGVRVVLPAMTRSDLLIAADLRQQRAASEQKGAEALFLIAEAMSDDDTTVGETYDPDEIADVLEQSGLFTNE